MLSLRLLRTIRHPFLVPRDYRSLVLRTEQVIADKRNHSGLSEEYWSEMLRMYAHIVDKGLQSANWEPGHSGQFYSLGSECLSRLRPAALEDRSILWARGRLSEHHDRQSGTRSPFERYAANAQCASADLVHDIKSRRSVRTFDGRPLPAAVLNAVLEVVNWAPSSCNRQTTRVYAATDPRLIEQCLATCSGATCFQVVPSFLCFCADLRPYSMPEELFTPYIDVSLGAQNCCMLAFNQGLSLTLLSWALHTEREDGILRSALGIPDYCEIVMNGVLGYPLYAVPTPERKPAGQTIFMVDDCRKLSPVE